MNHAPDPYAAARDAAAVLTPADIEALKAIEPIDLEPVTLEPVHVPQGAEYDQAVAVLHPLIEGVGRDGQCRWQTHTLCPAYRQAQAAVEALRAAGWRPPVACRSCDDTGYLRGGQHDGEECPACTEEVQR